ncbi:glycogenin glucosyltransferase [Pseudogymnoascus verrucosus]|uniref:glycogenin glucosyltransferase n=1 Tax=Pseudogymnoascus verrucosus TaxID=342668 RepID=A0A1B8GXP4_9PEZI|nr:glycogenin glucosyltransferase [Pseudogymnoascus verrucosus]OBU00604.1 glycogenin glucosyltransferase [Pseudogymnoascus verrucosus]
MATEDVYATLLLNDLYLPGALVLAHSLRDAGTTKKLAVLVTLDSVSVDAMVELQRVYDHIIPVDRMVNQQPQNLSLMDRVDLHSTFTKITLWKQLQFRRIVYMDADMVAWRAPDELFAVEAAFSAAPDIGWPDIFNTGLMVLTPNMGDYWALYAMAQRGISFDGADQGLLNMHFKNSFNRLSFTYNVTPSAHYQYIPAYKHFQSSISATHFIGKEKPWTQGREASHGSGPFDEITGRWWAVYDRHYRGTKSPTVQYYVKGEFQPPNYSHVNISHDQSEIISPEPVTTLGPVPVEESFRETTQIENEKPADHVEPIPEPAPFDPSPAPYVPGPASYPPEPVASAPEQLISGQLPIPHGNPPAESGPGPAYLPPSSAPLPSATPPQFAHEPVAPPFVAPFAAWDASRSAPPSGSKPEAANFPATQYSMSSDPTPYKAPERYPDPPKDMYYEVPKTPTYQKPAPIFPWETKDAPRPTRVFAEDEDLQPTSLEPTDDGEATDQATSPASTVTTIPSDPWHSFSSNSRNAWDDIPEIERYIGALQKNRKGNIQVLQGYGSGINEDGLPGSGRRRASVRVTDFPTEIERPSLPVTPAPIRRPKFQGGGDDNGDEGELPVAEGVPAQTEWDPAAQLEALARRQSEVLGRELGEGGGGKEIPQRPLPFGSEGVVVSSPGVADLQRRPSNPVRGSLGAFEEPSYGGPGALWEKDEGPVVARGTHLPPSEAEQDALAS